MCFMKNCATLGQNTLMINIGAYGKSAKFANMTFKYLFCIDFGKKKYEKWFFLLPYDVGFLHIGLDTAESFYFHRE